MSELAGQGVAILMISSELTEILGMSDRILVMREGRIVAEFARAATTEAIGAAMMSGVERGRAADRDRDRRSAIARGGMFRRLFGQERAARA